MSTAVMADALTKRFGSMVAVEELSFSLNTGTITAFLGPNGAGKTTTLRLLLGLTAPSSGRALVLDRPYAQLDQPARSIGAVLDATDFHPGRTGRDHLRVLARAAGLPDSRADEVLRTVELETAGRRRVKCYSLGMRQRLGLAAALLGDPEVLLLDEPANGLDPEGVRWLRDLLRKLASEGRTALVSSHALAEVEQMVDQVLIIDNGHLVVDAPLEQLTTRRGARVRVRTPAPDELARALRHEHLNATWDDHTLVIHGADCERVGAVAFAAGVPLHELRTDTSSLEEVFLELTSGERT